MVRPILYASICIPALLLTSCGDAIDSEARIDGEVSEWAVTVDEASAPAGDLTFRIKNSGSIDHEFLVVKTALADGAIPVEGGLFAEDQEGIQVVDEIPQFAAGRTEELTVTLDPGQYQLVCNLPGHYQAGMHTTFIVE